MLKKVTMLLVAIMLVLQIMPSSIVAEAFNPAEAHDIEYQNAVESGRLYLSIMPLSRNALIRQLVFEGFTQSQAEHAADVLDAETDWYQNAVESGRQFLEIMPLSRNGLSRQLASTATGFTQDQAEHAVGVLDAETDWYQNAIESGRQFLEIMPLSRNGLIRQLASTSTGFTQEQAEHAVGVLDAETDWYQNAVESGRQFLEIMSMSRDELIRQLSSTATGFTQSQAEFAARVIFDGYDPSTESPTVAPTQPAATEPPTVAPTQPEATEPPTVAPTQPEATEPPTIAPTQPESTEPPTVAPTQPAATKPSTGGNLPQTGAIATGTVLAGLGVTFLGVLAARQKVKNQ